MKDKDFASKISYFNLNIFNICMIRDEIAVLAKQNLDMAADIILANYAESMVTNEKYIKYELCGHIYQLYS